MIDLELEPLDYIEKIAELEYERVNEMFPDAIIEIDDKIKEYLNNYNELVKDR